jgi:hypothetical protein
MTATATRPGRQDPAALHWPGRQVLATDLWYPGQQDPIGPDQAGARWAVPDPLIYIAWVRSDSQRGGLQPRKTLHVQVNGG